MKIETLLQPEFNAAFSNLLDGNISQLNPKIVYRLKKMSNKFKSELETFESTRKSLCLEYCEKDEKGEAKIEGNKYVFTKENQIEFDKKFSELRQMEFDFGSKIEFTDIEKVKLTVKELLILEDVINDPV